MNPGYTSIVSALVLWIATGCNSEEDCPASASSCPDYCRELQAMQWDEDQACWVLTEAVTIGCKTKDDLTEAVESCIVRKSDGKAFRIGGISHASEFTRCGPQSDDSFAEECAPCMGDARNNYCDVEE